MASNSTGWLEPIFASSVLAELVHRLEAHRHAAATGQWGSCALVLAAGVQRRLKRPVLVITAHLDEADDAVDQLRFFCPDAQVALFPAYEVLPGESSISHELSAQRLELLEMLRNGSAEAASTGEASLSDSLFLVAPIQALMQPAPTPTLLADQLLRLGVGQQWDRDGLVRWLADHGYTRLDAVEDAGDFAVRGEIVDIWPPGDASPVRVDFFGDQIESLARFDMETLGTTEAVKEVRLAALGDRSTWPVDQTTSFLSYLPAEAVVWLVEPLEVQEQAKSYYDRLSDARGIYSPQAVLKGVQAFAWAEINSFGGENAGDASPVRLPCKSVQRFDTKPEQALRELAELAVGKEAVEKVTGVNDVLADYNRGTQADQEETEKAMAAAAAQGWTEKRALEKFLEGPPVRDVVIVCDNGGEVSRLRDLLDVKFPGVSSKLQVVTGSLTLGFEWDEREGEGAAGRPSVPSAAAPSLLLVGHHEIFHRYMTKRRLRAAQGARPIDSFLDLQDGDFVVHVQHGIARYEGMTTIQRDGRASEFLTLKFAGDATLHVPVTQIHMVQKYVGGAHGRPVLSVLGGARWSKQKEEVAKAVEEMAADLLEIQASREAVPGIAYPGDTIWQKEFENAFPYPPTEDQLRSVEEIKTDMGRPRPMDRLLCGDVGYGKTEVAMRAAFKAVEFGKQVAILAPTTVLCEQHEETFRARLAEYPFIVESISRFKTPGQVKKILDRTRAGQVDILIGTHRIISRDVRFADLGLVVIDEEQRFGVEHKERLKKLRLTVDVLTMTATPIPRTLHMSLLGIRDISNLATPPQDRRSVVTEVIPRDKARVKQALERELAREGQVYVVHNRIASIHAVAEEIRSLVPGARIVVGHGQMDPHELEEVMHKFIKHQADILVSTTIIESGIDIPNANTMLINQAENFGLSDLHQLRGRVGRWKHRAYCYLMLSPDKTISSTAAKRLKAMEEYASLGAGFKIALRDLEIRGAGNILGAQQSGHISAVGYEMYCQLLEDAVKKIKNQPIEKPREVNIDIGISGVLPKAYVDSERQRMDLYRRLSRCHTAEAIEALQKDMEDAFGPIPKPAQVLLALAELRLLAQQWGITGMIVKEPDVIFTLEDFAKLGPLMGKGPGSVRVVDAKTVHLRLPKPYLEPETLLHVLRHMFKGDTTKENPEAGNAKPQGKSIKPVRA